MVAHRSLVGQASWTCNKRLRCRVLISNVSTSQPAMLSVEESLFHRFTMLVPSGILNYNSHQLQSARLNYQGRREMCSELIWSLFPALFHLSLLQSSPSNPEVLLPILRQHTSWDGPVVPLSRAGVSRLSFETGTGFELQNLSEHS